MRHRSTGRLVLLLVGAASMAACAGDDDGPTTEPQPTDAIVTSTDAIVTSTDAAGVDPTDDGEQAGEGDAGDGSTSSSASPATDPPAAVTTDPSPTNPSTTMPSEAAGVPATTGGADTVDDDGTVQFTPIGAGPYDVGVATVVLPDAERPLTTDIWFPIRRDVDTTQLAPHRYTLLPNAYYESPTALVATPDLLADDGPFPLVVYSHGSGGLRYIHSSMTEAIASHGYVVTAPDHTGNTVIERIAGTSAPSEEIAVARPQDVRRVVDAFVDPANRTVGPYAAAVDPDRVAVAGHSLGGYTAIVSTTGFTNDVGTVEPDERIGAIVPIAPATSSLLTDELLTEIDVPTLILVGSDDVTTPPDPNVTRLWAALDDADAARPAYRIELLAAEHQTFTDICAYQAAVPALPDVPDIIVETIDAYAVEGCSPGDMPADRASELTNTYVIGFLDEVFEAGDPIGPDAVRPPEDVAIESR